MFTVIKKDTNSRARISILETLHGAIETPAYVVVGTHAKVRTLSPHDLAQTNTQCIIANTYHLWRTVGDKGLSMYPGLHAIMGWNKPIMTDSGGF